MARERRPVDNRLWTINFVDARLKYHGKKQNHDTQPSVVVPTNPGNPPEYLGSLAAGHIISVVEGPVLRYSGEYLITGRQRAEMLQKELKDAMGVVRAYDPRNPLPASDRPTTPQPELQAPQVQPQPSQEVAVPQANAVESWARSYARRKVDSLKHKKTRRKLYKDSALFAASAARALVTHHGVPIGLIYKSVKSVASAGADVVQDRKLHNAQLAAAGIDEARLKELNRIAVEQVGGRSGIIVDKATFEKAKKARELVFALWELETTQRRPETAREIRRIMYYAARAPIPPRR